MAYKKEEKLRFFFFFKSQILNVKEGKEIRIRFLSLKAVKSSQAGT